MVTLNSCIKAHGVLFRWAPTKKHKRSEDEDVCWKVGGVFCCLPCDLFVLCWFRFWLGSFLFPGQKTSFWLTFFLGFESSASARSTTLTQNDKSG